MDCVHHGYSGDGYASQRRNGVRRYCHHWAFIDHHGAISVGRVIDHICRNRWCVNPDPNRRTMTTTPTPFADWLRTYRAGALEDELANAWARKQSGGM